MITLSHHDRARGFTLIEVVLYIAIATGVVVAAFGLLQIMISTRTRYFAEAQVIEQATWANQRFIDLINTAATASISSPGPGQTSSTLLFSDGTALSDLSGVLTLTLPDTSIQALTSAAVNVVSASFTRAAAVDTGDIIQMELVVHASASQGTSLSVPTEHIYTTSASPLR